MTEARAYALQRGPLHFLLDMALAMVASWRQTPTSEAPDTEETMEHDAKIRRVLADPGTPYWARDIITVALTKDPTPSDAST